jgi:hypothetical protein
MSNEHQGQDDEETSALPPSRTSLMPPEPSVHPPANNPSSIPPPPRSRTLPPMPAMEPLLDQAEEARARGDHEAALDCYKRVLMVLAPTDARSRASVYASLGEIKKAQGRTREAESNFEKALTEAPSHHRSLAALVDLAELHGDWDRVITYRRRRLESVEMAEERARELFALAEILETRKNDIQAAIVAATEACELRPGHGASFERLRDMLVRAKAWTRLVHLHGLMAMAAESPAEIATHRFAQGDISLGRLRQEAPGLAFMEQCLAADPAHDRALLAVISVRQQREEWAELGRTYEGLIAPLAARKDKDRVWDVCRKLAMLKRDKLLDGPGAIDAFRGALEVRPDDVESRAALAELFVAKGQRDDAVRELTRAADSAPLRVQTYRRLFELHLRAQRPDQAWLAALCLEELGAEEVDHELFIGQYRTGAPIRPTTAMTDEWWADLSAPGVDLIVLDILAAISRAATQIRFRELEQKGQATALPESARIAASSTATIMRTFQWASRVLGVDTCALYSMGDIKGGLAAVPAAAPSTAVGEGVASGRSVQDLSFLVGRHLTYFRPGPYVLIFYPTLEDLTALLLGAVALAQGASPPDFADKAHKALRKELTNEESARLAEAVTALEQRGGTMDLPALLRGIELTAHRAGVLIAGDLRVGMNELRKEEREIAGLRLEDKRADLLRFAVSEPLSRLRERLGIAAYATQGPPSGPMPVDPS